MGVMKLKGNADRCYPKDGHLILKLSSLSEQLTSLQILFHPPSFSPSSWLHLSFPLGCTGDGEKALPSTRSFLFMGGGWGLN